MKNYLVYPCKIMRITQTYTGATSHYPHTIGTPVDYPIDEACKDAGREYMYCPCDEIKIMRIYGVGNGGTNTIWLQSTSKVYFADGTTDYVTMQVTHPNDDDLRKLYVGKKFKRGEKICREGMDGATGNHLHISAGKGKIKGTGWTKNTKGKWVLTTTSGTSKPEYLFLVDSESTSIVSSAGLKFKTLQNFVSAATAKTSKYKTGNYKVTNADVLNVRKGAGTKYAALTFYQLTKSAQKKILALTNNNMVNGYVEGLTFTVTKVSGSWGKTPSGWVCLDYCTKI